ncbi:MAG: hypothetical protein M1493_17265 [Firmicutes bacterium]|jgi:DnaJ-domain-containing protein 1|uniref:Uncharacterized protein n=1 Tax=Sulfobacillus benefaciens TaxID=453960 RepID=A0A2T2X6Q5_9FIRM|nr:hypothetical protein [Bacillota bacterium]PSR30138.1 MAG: hypothetical protein C7B43_07615 [Sulfobacillus benefaciens]HBQ95339.1 hypothetical protein [Sulfobacillus sp.]
MDDKFDTLITHLMTLKTLTEQKIEAATLRDAERLVQLLQDELDPLNWINTHLPDIAQLNSEERQIIHRHAAIWQERTQFLHETLGTQLGYCDFVRMLIGNPPFRAVNIDL